METVIVSYAGSALPGNAETVDLFSSVIAFQGANTHVMMGYPRFQLSLKNDQAGTLSVWESTDRGVNWTQVRANEAVAAAAAGTESTWDFYVGSYKDFRVRWVNGATPQTTFRVNMALSPEAAPTTP